MYPIYIARIWLGFIILAVSALPIITLLSIFRPLHRNNMGDLCILLDKINRLYWRVKIEYENEERLTPEQTSVIIANHQDTHDMFLAESGIRRGTVALGKWELIYIPVIGLVFFLGGNIMIKRTHKAKARKALARAGKELKDKDMSVMIFPEGTRNRGKPLHFKLGAFKLAIESGVPIQPVCYSLRHQTLDYYKWNPGTIKVKCLEPISTEGLTQDDALDLAIRCRKLMEAECTAITKSLPQYREQGYKPLI